MKSEKNLLPLQPFVISIKGLKPGKSHFEWHAGREFFEAFENSEVLDADIQVNADVEYYEDSIGIKCAMEGTVVVICDRCLEDLTLPVHTDFELGDEDVDLCHDIDLHQDVYDFVCISLPMQRVHPEGECNEETVKFLSK